MRLVVFSSMPAAALDHLLWRLAIDLPEVTVAGILYETNRPTLGRGNEPGASSGSSRTRTSMCMPRRASGTT